MTCQVPVSSGEKRLCADAPADGATPPATEKLSRSSADSKPQAIAAHSLEFVALPGRAEGIQCEIPAAVAHAFGSSEGFAGCLVLVSEQESRLVTVITMWSGSKRFELCSRSGDRLRKWLSPYVDRWLRTRKYASFFMGPHEFVAGSCLQDAMAEGSAHLQ